ncbi:HXXEE domain-containing protein [Clostridium botulinum]|uniref:HXXEE domain-containing protein n=1 Tax=Clostridium botulinum TaxID=1491 RepID=UPI0012693581|nr:HXXEE domain-containing protein [Clostridium botulinum]
MAFTLHLILHCLQALIVRKHIPAIITSVICLPICIYITKHVVELFPLSTIILYSTLGFIIMILNLGVIHKGMDIFNKWLIKYAKKNKKIQV